MSAQFLAVSFLLSADAITPGLVLQHPGHSQEIILFAPLYESPKQPGKKGKSKESCTEAPELVFPEVWHVQGLVAFV